MIVNEIDVDRCNSIFELFTAFNFTYTVLSAQDSPPDNDNTSFMDVIDMRLLRVFSTLIRKCQNISSQIYLIRESIDTYTLQSGIPQNIQHQLHSIKGKIDELETRCELRIKELSTLKQQQKEKLNETLPYICFLMAFFCIETIGVSISQAPFKHFSLFLLVISFITILLSKIVFSITSFYSLAKFITFTTIIIITFHFTSLVNFDNYSENIKSIITFFDTNIISKTLLIMFSLTLPLCHFVYYFFTLSSTLIGYHEQRVLLIDDLTDGLKRIEDDFGKIGV